MKLHGVPRHAHPVARLNDATWTRGTYLRMGIAGIVGAPLLWLFMVVFLSALGEPS